MEKATIHSLHDMVAHEAKVQYKIVVAVMLNLLNCLKSYHADGKVYGAVMPSNISVYPEENYKVELRTGINPVELPDDLSGMGLDELLGLSPEHFNGNQGLDHRSDLYGLGYIAYYLLTGQANPYAAETAADLAEKIKMNSVPEPSLVNPEVPEWLSRIVQKLTAPDQSQRYQSVFSLIRNIESGLATEPKIQDATPDHEPMAAEPEPPSIPTAAKGSDFNPYQPISRDKPLKSAQGLVIKGLFAGLGIVVVIVAALLYFLKGGDNRQIESELSTVLDSTLAEPQPASINPSDKADAPQTQVSSGIDASQFIQTGITRKITVQVDDLRIRKTPGTDGEIIVTVNEGYEAMTTGRITNWKETINFRGVDYYKPWIEVTSANNVTGWIFAGATDY